MFHPLKNEKMKPLRNITKSMLVTGLMFGSYFINAQQDPFQPARSTGAYKYAVGLRAGETSGLTFKRYFTDAHAAELIVGVWPNAIGITGLYEHNVPWKALAGFNWYYGAGAHINVATSPMYRVYYYKERYYAYRSAYPGIGIGIDGVFGAEYKVPGIPVAISLDLKPFFEVNSGAFFSSIDPGLGIKVTF